MHRRYTKQWGMLQQHLQHAGDYLLKAHYNASDYAPFNVLVAQVRAGCTQVPRPGPRRKLTWVCCCWANAAGLLGNGARYLACCTCKAATLHAGMLQRHTAAECVHCLLPGRQLDR